MNDGSATGQQEQLVPPFGAPPPSPEVILEGQPHILIDNSSEPSRPLEEVPGEVVSPGDDSMSRAWEGAYPSNWQSVPAANNGETAQGVAENEQNGQGQMLETADQPNLDAPNPNGTLIVDREADLPNDLENQQPVEQVDNKADKISVWANVLDEHPVSEQYKETHPDIDFSAPVLSRIEEVAEADLETAQMDDKDLDELPVDVLLFGLPSDVSMISVYDSRPSMVFTEAFGLPDSSEMAKSKWAEWDNLIASPETNLGQLKSFYTEAFRTAYITPKINSANMVRSVLEDVRSGRASQ